MMIIALALPTFAGIGKILVFLLMLSVLVLLHEYGHFLIARRNKVRVNDFALGMGPTLLKWTSPRSGTNYRLNLFPIGGYCAMQGEDGKTNEAAQRRDFLQAGGPDDDNFQAKKPLQRLAIVLGGPIANFIVAIVLLVVISVGYGTPVPTTTVGAIQSGMPAAKVGLHPGDRIASVDGVAMRDGEQLVETIHRSAGKPLHLGIDRNGTPITIDVTPVSRAQAGKTIGLIGFAPQSQMVHASLGAGITQSVTTFWSVSTMQLGMLASLVTAPAQTFSGLSGPIGIAAVSGQVQDLGWGPYLFLAAQLSISLGIFNLLPIPALDGGRAIFIVFELLRGKPVDPEKEALVHFAGFAMLMLLMVFVAYNDIVRLVAGKGTI